MTSTFRDLKLPSNRKFGFFFAFVFFVIFLYYLINSNNIYSAFSISIAIAFLLVTCIKPNLLYPLNKLWMILGLAIGIIVSPLVLGVLFFGIFTPLAALMRVYGRDELRLKKTHNKSHWIYRKGATSHTHSFGQQF